MSLNDFPFTLILKFIKNYFLNWSQLCWGLEVSQVATSYLLFFLSSNSTVLSVYLSSTCSSSYWSHAVIYLVCPVSPRENLHSIFLQDRNGVYCFKFFSFVLQCGWWQKDVTKLNKMEKQMSLWLICQIRKWVLLCLE